MKIQRRDFLKSTLVAGAGVMTLGPYTSVFGNKQANRTKRLTEGWYPSTCMGCTTWCPIELYQQNGRITKVRGNQHSKVNPGTVCPRGHLIPQIVYDPDRVKVPMKRTNPVKGKGINPQFVPITWQEAMDTIADKIMELRNNNETHKFMVMRGRYTGMFPLIYDALPKIVGSPNNISHSSICAEAEKCGSFFTEGFFGYRDYDLLNTKCLVLWGVDPFRSNRQVPGTMDKLPKMIENGTELITIDPVFTSAAAKSKHWLAIKPGHDGALAVAIAHHLLVKGLWNREFVGDFNGTGVNQFIAQAPVNESDFTEAETRGLVKWWNIELKDKTPAWASSVTGIPQNKIELIAEEMAAKAPYTVIWYGPGATMSPRGTYAGMAIYALNGLLGSVDNQGGAVRPKSGKVASLPSMTAYQDEVAQEGLTKKKIDQRGTLALPAIASGTPGSGVVTNNVANAMLANDPYDLKVVIGYWCNFNFSCTQPERWDEAFAALPFFAHITTHASEMSQFADIVLPAAYPTSERYAFVRTAGNLYGETSIQQPISNRYFDAKSDENEMMFMLAEALAAKGFSNLLNFYKEKIVDPETNAQATNPQEFELYSTKFFTKPAWEQLSGGWNEYLEKGVVSEGPATFRTRWGGNFTTETKYFEFYSETLKKSLTTHAAKFDKTIDEVMEVCNYEARGELVFVPHYESPKRWGSKEEFPFEIIDNKSRLAREGRSGNLVWHESFFRTNPGEVNWTDNIQMNPSDAAALGISHLDNVRITSMNGSFITKAVLWQGVQPGTICKTYGRGHWAYGRFASDYANLSPKGVNTNNILMDDYDRISGSTARNGGFVGVKIEKV